MAEILQLNKAALLKNDERKSLTKENQHRQLKENGTVLSIHQTLKLQ